MASPGGEDKVAHVGSLCEAILKNDGSEAVYLLMYNDWDPRYPISVGREKGVHGDNKKDETLLSRKSPWEIALQHKCDNVVQAFLRIESTILKRDWTVALVPKRRNRNCIGWSILKLSLFYGNLPAARLLLSQGACPNTPPHDIPNAYDLLVPRDNMELFRLLLDNGYDVNRQKWLHQLISYDHLEGLKLALSYGPDVNLQNALGMTPLLLVATRPEFDSFADMMRALLQHGADPNLANRDGDAVIHAVARHAIPRADFVKSLVEAGAIVDARNQRGSTALHVLASTRRKHRANGSLENFIRTFVHHGLDVNAREDNDCRRTPLHQAVLCANVPVTRALLRVGANVEARDAHGWTPWHYACLPKHDDMEGCMGNLLALHDARADPLACTTRKHRSGLHHAIVEASNHRVVSFAFPLIRKILNIAGDRLVHVADHKGFTPLHYAALVGNPDLIQMLLEYGCDPNTCDAQGRTALHLLCGRRLILASVRSNTAPDLAPLDLPLGELVLKLTQKAEWSGLARPSSVDEIMTQERHANDDVVVSGFREERAHRALATKVLLAVPGVNTCAVDSYGHLTFFMACINDAPLEQILVMVQSAALQGLFG